MKTALKNRWVAALRSGKFTQTSGGLVSDDGNVSHCCLGVLCAISPAVARRVKEERNNGPWQEAGVLTESALAYAGLDDATQWYLANMNDEKYSFRRIATYIEKNL